MEAAAALLNYGAVGVLLILALSGFIVPKGREDRLIAERDRAETQRDEVLRDVLTNVAPAIVAATEAIRARESHDNQIYDVLVDVRRHLEAR